MKMILDLFAGGHSVTCYKDANASAFSASPNSDVAKDADVALTVTPASGYEVDEIEVISGGVTVTYDADDGYAFVMGEADVVLNLKTKKNNLYKVTEETMASVNESKVVLHQNTTVVLTPNGAPKEITVKNGGAEITSSAAVQQLIDQGILVKI